MPLDFLKRRGGGDGQPAWPLPDEIAANEHTLKLQYTGRSSEGVRFQPGTDASRELQDLMLGVAIGPVELVEPLPVDLVDARPDIVRPEQAAHWLQAHSDRSPTTRHALFVLESVDAVDPAFDTMALGLLHGDLDTTGYPAFTAIVGGIASHWDEGSGEMVARAVVGWGGRGVRGDTSKTAQGILSGILRNLVASERAVGVTTLDEAAPGARRGGMLCPHCGFTSAHERAVYCPKCGMRLVRG